MVIIPEYRRFAGIIAHLPILTMVVMSHLAWGQTPSTALTITAPPDGSIVTPGQTLNISVTRTTNSGIAAVALHAFDWTPTLSGSDPLVFSITVPINAQPGPVPVIAFDLTPKAARGVGIISAPVTIVVQNPLMTSIRSDLKAIHLRFVGDSYHLALNGTTLNGASMWLGNSTAISFSSQLPTVAAIDQTGLVSAIGSGQATITATYTNPDATTVTTGVSVFVPNLVRGDFNGDGRVDTDDLNILNSALNQPANGPNDARDLNHDGIINALDARILTTLCTYPRCATHP